MTETGYAGSMPASPYKEKIEKTSQRLSESSFRTAAEFKRVAGAMASQLSLKEFEVWADLGLQLGSISGRSWDCSAEYFKASPKVMSIEVFGFLDLHQWVSHGRELAALSSEAAASYFQHSPIFIDQIDLWSLEKWVQLGRKLLENHAGSSWRSAKLAATYFQASLDCLPIFGLRGLDEWVEVAVILNSRSHDATQAFLENSAPWFSPFTDEERDKILHISKAIAENNFTVLYDFFSLLEQHHNKIKAEVRKPAYEICLNISRHSPEDALNYLEQCPVSLSCVENKDQLRLMEMGVRLSSLNWEAALKYVHNLPEILAALPAHKVAPWFEAGLDIASENTHAGTAYYAMESRSSQEVITSLQRTVHLEDVNRLLNLYSEGLTARKLKIKKIDSGDNGSAPALPNTDGEFIHLPGKVAEFEDYTKNFKWYKVATAHQAGYYEYGTFDFSIRSLRQEGILHIPSNLREKVQSTERNDLEGFFQLFKDSSLASALFRIIEDGRVDYLLGSNYRGLKRDMSPVMEHLMAGRPPLEELTPRNAALELLLRITTIRQASEELEPSMALLHDFLRTELNRVFAKNATVIDSALVTSRVYPVIKSLPDSINRRDEIIEALARRLETCGGELSELLDTLLVEAEAASDELNEEGGEPFPLNILEFRGDTKPEEVQKLMKLREIKDNIEQLNEHGVPLPLELLKELLKMGVEMEITELDEEALENSSGLFITNIDGLAELPAYKKMKEMMEEEPEAIEQFLYGDIGINHPNEIIYYYDEWDHLINDYRARWCRLKEISPGETDTEFVEETLRDNAELINIIRRQFQMLRPEMFRKVKKLENGEEIDIDAVIQAVTEMRCRVTPSEKVYQRRDKRERDVSALFLLDVSASTDEEVEKNISPLDPGNPSWQEDKYSRPGYARGYAGPPPPPEPKEKKKRIIDVEKEALVLMAEALESIGDGYAISAFSGYGRDNVEYFTIKDFNERYTDKIKSRIGAIKPQRSTRMGPAIRHAVSKLDQADSRLKILILLSDGYPQDFDYGKDRTSKEYGIQDTARALHEAREKNIHPFLITVDPAGNDYLKDMCGKNDYMVIEKVSSLPQELIRTYRTLTYR